MELKRLKFSCRTCLCISTCPINLQSSWNYSRQGHMNKLKELIQGKIYCYEVPRISWELLFKLESPGFSLSDKGIDTVKIMPLTTNIEPVKFRDHFTLNMKHMLKEIRKRRSIIKEVPLEDLPLYIGMPYKTKAFTELLKGPQ